MGFAEAADLPVVIAADIERGGVIAALVGTHALLPPTERARVAGFIVNKFRGDPALFEGGVRVVEERTGWRSLGVVPWFAGANRLPAEDSVDLVRKARGGTEEMVVAVPLLPHIANFDDLDPLRLTPGVALRPVRPGEPIPAEAELVILPGSKTTISDLAAFRTEGWDVDLLAHVRRGGRVLGICGGYQMLGRAIADPEGIEGKAGSVEGLGLLDVETRLAPGKRLAMVEGRHSASGEKVAGYEMHLGETEGPDRVRPFLEVAGNGEGAVSKDGRVAGTYLHGLFAADGFRTGFLEAPAGLDYEGAVDETLDALAVHLEANVDVAALLGLAGR